ncbi:MAG: hypothetical protein ACKOW1_04375, partial [Novosphingobium sp.]
KRKSRLEALVGDILALEEGVVRAELAAVLGDFGARHWQIEDVFDQRFNQIAWQLKLDPAAIPRETRRLIGGYFCHEYSYAAAAVMNPSVVRHPDQSGLKEGCVRFIMVQRAVGAMRKYAIGAVLLDKDDPAKVLGRTARPLLTAAEQDREGYVPNVIYTCGAIRVGENQLFMPFGVADSSICFGFFDISAILNLL